MAWSSSAYYRALNYFTIQELVHGRSADLRSCWKRALDTIDVSQPMELASGPALGRLDWDPDLILRALGLVKSRLDRLDPDDAVVVRGDVRYPRRLLAVPDSPEVLFLRGRSGLLEAPCLAVVGTRKPTDEGILRARKLGYLLAKRGMVVVSGLARGIDQAAHRGALEAGGDTAAVLGTALTECYPQEHRGLQDLIAQTGLVVSQFLPGTRPLRQNFPIRNATMSGLCLGTVVVEASETSGALIQARKCLQQGRKLLIPRSAVEDERLAWPKAFVTRGAVVFEDVDGVLRAIDALMPSMRSRVAPVRLQGENPGCYLRLTSSDR